MALKWWHWWIMAKRAFTWRWLLSLDMDDRIVKVIEDFRRARDEALRGQQ